MASFDFHAGEVLLIDKPKDWTSFDVVKKVRNSIKGKIKIGHAGTLDPLATGLLILCTGKKTKEIEQYQAQEKEYTGTLKFGARTASYDSETEVEEEFDISHLNLELINEKIESFQGIIDQTAPAYSALKINGVPSYKLARQGKKVELKTREVNILEYRIDKLYLPYADIYVQCSKGTYIRSLAHDLGSALNSGAYLTALCRTKIGAYRLEDAWNLSELIEAIKKNNEDSSIT